MLRRGGKRAYPRSSLIQSQPTNWTNLFPLLGWKEEGNHPSYTNNNQLDESISFVARGGKRAYPRSSLIQYQPTNWTNLFPLLGCTVANILALLRNIDLEPQTQSRMQRKFTEVGIRGKLRNKTEVINFLH